MGGYITMAATIKSRVDHLSASVCVHYSSSKTASTTQIFDNRSSQQ